MAFSPVIIGSGLSAWTFLKSTQETQQRAHASTYQSRSDTKHFLASFASIRSVEDIVSDRRMLRVVLGAYGLSDDIDNRFFIRTILEEGTTDTNALANKLSDRRYRALARDFDFSTDSPAQKLTPNLAEQVVSRFRLQSFEEAVGKTKNNMRLALTFKRSLEDVVTNAGSNSASWFQVLATPPLREVIQTALRLPSQFSNLDIDDQHARLISKTERVFGTNVLSDLANPDLSEQVVRQFLAVRQATQSDASDSFQTALTLLRAMPR